MAKNKWTKELRAYEDSVDYEYDSYAPEIACTTKSLFQLDFCKQSKWCS